MRVPDRTATVRGMSGQPPEQQVLDAAVASAREVFDQRLAAVYALGSLAHGGFAPLVSDVDVAIVLTATDSGTAEQITRVGRLTEQRCPSALTERLSLFWTDGNGVRRGPGVYGRLSDVDRLDLIDAGLLLTGTDQRAGAVRPDSAGIIRESAELAAVKFDDGYLRSLTARAALVARGARDDEFLDAFVRDLPNEGVDAPELTEELRARRTALRELTSARPRH
jgi:hypothetical protein